MSNFFSVFLSAATVWRSGEKLSELPFPSEEFPRLVILSCSVLVKTALFALSLALIISRRVRGKRERATLSISLVSRAHHCLGAKQIAENMSRKKVREKKEENGGKKEYRAGFPLCLSLLLLPLISPPLSLLSPAT